VSLPPGYTLAASSLQAQTSAGQSAVSSTGQFTATVYGDGPQLCTILGPSGKPVLVGWLAGDRKTISTKSTAEVLLYFGLGAFAHRESVRSWTLDTIAQSSQLAAVTEAVNTALAANPEALNQSPADITAAVRTALTALQGSRAATPAARRSVASSAAGSRSVLIDPSDSRSGITPVQETMTSVKIINAYRRRAWAYVDRVSYVPSSGGAAVPSPEKITNFEIQPVFSPSGLIGTFVDIMYGNCAYSQISTDPISLPLNPADAKETTYKLTVVGAGLYKGDADSITSDQSRGLYYVTGKTILRDFVLPLILNVVMNLKGEELDDMLEWYNGSAVLGDLINTLFVAAPGIWDKAYAGDMSGAVWDAYQTIQTSGTVKAAFLELIRSGFSNIKDANRFTEYAQGFLNVLALGDIILTSIDSAVQATHVAISNRADIWNITVNGSKVKLSPAVSYIMPNETATLHAAVPDATGSSGEAPLLAYHWTGTGTHGSLSDGTHQGNDFDSNSADVVYKPKGSSAGTDTVTVEVLLVAGGARTPLGAASASVTVQERSHAPTLYPRKVSVYPGDSQTFTAQLDMTGVDPRGLTFRWSTPGAYGTLKNGNSSFETTSSSMDYFAKAGVEGQDTVRVEALVVKEGKKTSLGAATSTILVEKRKTVMMGDFSVEVVDTGDNRYAIFPCVIVPKVEGASHYSVYCYGFNDWAYYGTSLSINSPFGGSTMDRGNAYYVPVAGFWADYGPNGEVDEGTIDWYYSRFKGMQVEVTITY